MFRVWIFISTLTAVLHPNWRMRIRNGQKADNKEMYENFYSRTSTHGGSSEWGQWAIGGTSSSSRESLLPPELVLNVSQLRDGEVACPAGCGEEGEFPDVVNDDNCCSTTRLRGICRPLDSAEPITRADCPGGGDSVPPLLLLHMLSVDPPGPILPVGSHSNTETTPTELSFAHFSTQKASGDSSLACSSSWLLDKAWKYKLKSSSIRYNRYRKVSKNCSRITIKGRICWIVMYIQNVFLLVAVSDLVRNL